MVCGGKITGADELRRLYGFHRWATLRLLDAAAALPAEALVRAPDAASPSPDPASPAPRDALVRLLWSDWVWLRRFYGLSPRIVFDPDDYPDVAALRAKWAEVHDEMADLLGPLTDAGSDRPVAYRDLRGQRGESPLGVLLLNLIVAASGGRGAVAAALRRLGCPAPEGDDLLAYLGGGGAPDRPGPRGADGAGGAGGADGDVGSADAGGE